MGTDRAYDNCRLFSARQGSLSFGEDAIVVRLDDAGHIGQTAIANLYSAAIEYLLQLGTLWKMLVDRLQKSLTDAGLNTLAIWWVKPYHLSRSSPFRLRTWRVGGLPILLPVLKEC